MAVTFIIALALVTVRATAEEQQARLVRVHNALDVEQRIEIGGTVWPIAPGAAIDLTISARELETLRLSSGMLAVERRTLDGEDAEELHVLRQLAVAACSTTVAVRVPLLACRFGTAEAQVEPIPGATYAWSAEGATIVSGNGTPSVLLGFGGARSAVARVTVTENGCVSAGAAVLNLRDPLSATMSVPEANAGTPVRLTWSYNTAEPVLTQILELPDGAAPIRLAPELRSYTFTPAVEGSKTVKLTAALYRIGARRRAVRSGSGPRASSCSLVEAQREMRVRPRCTGPRARVSGGGSACDAVSVHAQFEGTAPFRGRWSDGVSFATSAIAIDRTVTETGTYTIVEFEDANCAGSTSGAASVEIQPPTRVTALAMSPQAVSVQTYAGRISWGYENATDCRFTSALDNYFGPTYPTCSSVPSASGVMAYIPDNQAGNETLTFRVTGPCGTDERSVQFFVCGYNAKVAALGPTTFCDGGSVTLSVSEFDGPTAGPPYSDFRFYRCTGTGPSSCSYEWQYELVQRGASSTYSATKTGWYIAIVNDRLGCPSIQSSGVQVKVTNCP